MATGEPCSFEGNSDIYGIGVRYGFYLQWFATLLITIFSPSEEETVRIVNLTIQTSIFLGIAVQSSDETNPVEPIIVLFLMCGSLSSLTFKGLGNWKHVSGVFRTLFYAALSAYGIWFWWVGLDKMMKAAGDGCVAIAFFGRTKVDGRFRTFGKAISIIGLVLSVFLIGVCVNALWERFRDRFDHAMKRPRRQRPQVEIMLLLLSAGLIAFSIAVVEYLIRVNGITGLQQIDAVGQFIPFLIGIFECTSIGWRIVIKGLFWRRKCWFLFGKHL
jgi:hypothetical protein